MMGDLGWIWAARGYGVLRSMKRQPYLAQGK
jgi:hypothetical protein